MAFASTRIEAQTAIIKPCDLCEDDENASWFCKECYQNLCDRCKLSHLRSNISKSHNVLSISEGIVVAKRYISNICERHSSPFHLRCLTCGQDICLKCLSKHHRKHDFIDLQDLKSEAEEELNSILKEKERKVKQISDNIDAWSEYEQNFTSEVFKFCKAVDERLQVVKEVADEEADNLKRLLRCKQDERMNHKKEYENEIITKKKLFLEQIENIRQESRLHSASSMVEFIKESKIKLRKLQSNLRLPPNDSKLLVQKSFDRRLVQDLLGNIDDSVFYIDNEEAMQITANLIHLRVVEVIGIGAISSICAAPDGNIWIGTEGWVLKVHCDGTILSRVKTRNKSTATFMACLQTGDAIVSSGTMPTLDRFTQDGRRDDFAHLSRNKAYNVTVSTQNDIVVREGESKLITLSDRGIKKSKIILQEKYLVAFCVTKNGDIVISERSCPYLTIVDGKGKCKEKRQIMWKDIVHLTCDRFGNVLATNKRNDIYFFSADGNSSQKYTIEGTKIDAICIDSGCNLLIAREKSSILFARYLKY